jgi:lipopolysaccharide export LptBFGC system permease protein LptF
LNISILDRYFFKDLLLASLGNTIVLTCILLYGNLQKNSDLLIQSFAYSPSSFLELTSYLIPYSLSMGLPFGFSLAILFSLGRMASNREILALGSHGVGCIIWARPIFLLSILLSIISTFSHLEWGPKNRALFDERQREIVWSNLNLLLLQKGQIELDLNSENTQSGIRGIGELVDEDISKISISVGNVFADTWQNVRIVLKHDDDKISSILHAGEAIATISADRANLILNLRDLDVEPGFSGHKDQGNESSLFISFKKWKNPVMVNLPQVYQPDHLSFKRMKLAELLTALDKASSTDVKSQIRLIIHKGFALGFSPFFLCCFLLPVSALKGRQETMVNITIGIIVCIAYFGIGKFFSNMLTSYGIGFAGWWLPNLLCLLFGITLMRSLRI